MGGVKPGGCFDDEAWRVDVSGASEWRRRGVRLGSVRERVAGLEVRARRGRRGVAMLLIQ